MSTQKRLFTAMTPSFCSLTDTKQSLQYTIKTHLSGPPMPKFEANMNYIPPSPPSSMKQRNKSATVKFHMELLLTTTTRKQCRSGATPYPNNHRLFIRQTTYSCPKIFVYTRAAPVHFCAKPNSNPNPNLSPSSTQAVPLPGEIAIDLTEMQVAAHAKTRCRIVRL